MGELTGWLDDYAWGALVIVKVTVAGLLMGVTWGLIGAGAKLSGNRMAAHIADAYTTVLRGTPELLVLLIVYYGSAVTLTSIAQLYDPEIKFFDIPPFWAGSFAVSLIFGAYATETFRGAFLGVDRGQIEAARSLGLSKFQTFVYVRVPQMWRIALPAFGNHWISLLKDTALISVVGLEEIMYTADIAMTVTHKPFLMYSVVAVIYLFFTSIVTASIWGLEKYANRHLQAAR